MINEPKNLLIYLTSRKGGRMDRSGKGEDKRKGGREDGPNELLPVNVSSHLPSLVILLFDLRRSFGVLVNPEL